MYTLRTVREALAECGIRIVKREDEFRVSDYKAPNARKEEAGAYYTDDLEDALLTGRVMARNRDRRV